MSFLSVEKKKSEEPIDMLGANMLKGEDIICISWLVWDSIPLVMHHMMKRLAKNNRVLFVDPAVAYSNLVIKPSLLKNHLKKTFLWMRGVRRVQDNLHVYYPPPLFLQYGHFNTIDRLSQAYTSYTISKAADKLGYKKPILWIYHPYAVNPTGQFNEKLICYDCNDDVGFFFTKHFNKRKNLSLKEDQLTRKADIVFTTSKYLYHLRKLQNPNTFYLPSALDLDIFQRTMSPYLNVASEVKEIRKPIIGFIGGITNSKINWEWINEAAASHSFWNFVFLGPCSEPPPSCILEKKNIIFIGPKPQEELPAYLKGFDVGLIPYQGDDFLKACQPTKAFEYLAAGKPVVSSWIPELEEYQGLILLSRNINEFIQNIEKALRIESNDELIDSVNKVTGKMTWEERVKKASKYVGNVLVGRGNIAVQTE